MARVGPQVPTVYRPRNLTKAVLEQASSKLASQIDNP